MIHLSNSMHSSSTIPSSSDVSLLLDRCLLSLLPLTRVATPPPSQSGRFEFPFNPVSIGVFSQSMVHVPRVQGTASERESVCEGERERERRPFGRRGPTLVADAMMTPDEDNPFAPQARPPPPVPRRTSNHPSDGGNPFAQARGRWEEEQGGYDGEGTVGEIHAVNSKAYASTSGTYDLERREREVRKKELELQAREKALQEAIRTAPKPPNWPKCKPIVYHSIVDDIPVETQRMVRVAYVTWMITFVGYLYNWLVIFLMFVSGTDTGVGDWFFATLVSSLGIPLSFFLWYRALYRAAQTQGSTLAYGKFFLHWLVHMVWTVWTLVAAPTVADYCAGFFIMIRELDSGGSKGIAFAVMTLINIVIWMTIFFLSFWMGKQAMSEFRSGGGPGRVRGSARTAADVVLEMNGSGR